MKRPITVISLISIFLFIVALVWFGAGIYKDGKSGSEQNKLVFESLVYNTVSAANSSEIGTPEFSKKFIDAVGNIENYSSLHLNVNGKMIYSYPPAGFSLPSAVLTDSFTQTKPARGGLLVTISASMYTIKTNSVYHYAKFAFVLILLGTSISLFLLLILGGKEKNDFSKSTEADANKNDNFDIDFDDAALASESGESSEQIFNLPDEDIILDDDENPLEEEKEPDFEDNKDDGKKASEEKLDETEKEEKNEEAQADYGSKEEKSSDERLEKNKLESDKNNEKTELESDENSEDDEKTELESDENLEADAKTELDSDEKTELESDENLESDEKTEDAPRQPKPAFDLNASVDQISPATGLKLQSALLPELDEKIKSSIAKRTELSLALLKVNGLDRGNSISNRIVKILKDKIANADEIYEYNSDGYAIILENKALSSCADIFDDVYEKMTSFLKENNSINEVVIGLSSLSKRKTDAKRLATEAGQALEHALEDPDSPIIAFRTDPEKSQI